MKTTSERSVEALTWAAVVIWLGFTLVTHLLGYAWLVVMVLGIILLSSAIYQRARGWQTSLSLWISGIWMAVFSVIEVTNALFSALNDGEGLNIDLWVYLGIALVSMGVAVVLRSVHVPGMSEDKHTTTSGTYERQPYIPQTNNTSSGWSPPISHQDTSSASWPPAGGSTYSSQAVESPRAAVSQVPYEAEQPQQGAWDANPSAGWESSPRRVQSSRRTARPAAAPRRRTARPADEPADLESRVEDIIRRSRERRQDTNLPY